MFWAILGQDVAALPGPVVDPGAMGDQLVEAISTKNYGLAVGAALMLLIWVGQLVYPKLKGDWTPVFAVVLCALGGAATSLLMDPSNVWSAISAFVSTGLMAVGTYELFKKLAKKFKKKKTNDSG